VSTVKQLTNRTLLGTAPRALSGLFASDVISYCLYTTLPSTVGAAKEGSLGLHTVADDLAAAMLAYRGQLVDGAFEAVEGMRLAGRDDLEGEIVVVSAYFTSSH
jgi:hypothetical protein